MVLILKLMLQQGLMWSLWEQVKSLGASVVLEAAQWFNPERAFSVSCLFQVLFRPDAGSIQAYSVCVVLFQNFRWINRFVWFLRLSFFSWHAATEQGCSLWMSCEGLRDRPWAHCKPGGPRPGGARTVCEARGWCGAGLSTAGRPQCGAVLSAVWRLWEALLEGQLVAGCWWACLLDAVQRQQAESKILERSSWPFLPIRTSRCVLFSRMHLCCACVVGVSCACLCVL